MRVLPSASPCANKNLTCLKLSVSVLFNKEPALKDGYWEEGEEGLHHNLEHFHWAEACNAPCRRYLKNATFKKTRCQCPQIWSPREKGVLFLPLLMPLLSLP